MLKKRNLMVVMTGVFTSFFFGGVSRRVLACSFTGLWSGIFRGSPLPLPLAHLVLNYVSMGIWFFFLLFGAVYIILFRIVCYAELLPIWGVYKVDPHLDISILIYEHLTL